MAGNPHSPLIFKRSEDSYTNDILENRATPAIYRPHETDDETVLGLLRQAGLRHRLWAISSREFCLRYVGCVHFWSAGYVLSLVWPSPLSFFRSLSLCLSLPRLFSFANRKFSSLLHCQILYQMIQNFMKGLTQPYRALTSLA